MHAAVALGVVAASATLAGALLVGDSMRASLREVAVGRLGSVDLAVRSAHFAPATLASRLEKRNDFQARWSAAVPVILLTGGVTHAQRRTHVERVNIIGADQRFTNAQSQTWGAIGALPSGRTVTLNRALADELGAKPGDDVLLRMGKPSDVSIETLLGRRDDTTTAIRLTVHSILPSTGMGAFSLNPRQAIPRNAFVPLRVLQRALGKPNRCNTTLVTGSRGERDDEVDRSDVLREALGSIITLADAGLTLRIDPEHAYVALESGRILIDPVVEDAASDAARSIGATATGILTHLANRIARSDTEESPDARAIPYSTIAAIDPGSPQLSQMIPAAGSPPPTLSSGGIILNEWAANDLGARPGDAIVVDYYVTGEMGRFETKSATLTLSTIVRLEGAAADPGFIPDYPGVTDTENLGDWDAPFPIDFRVIRDEDEEYWDRYRTTPKAFVALSDGQALWTADIEQLGRLTSIRLTDRQRTPQQLAKDFETAWRDRLVAEHVGFRIDPVRAQAEHASKGTTDFGMLFIGFSFFLIASSAMLVALMFRLGVERRSPEIGILLAGGFAPRTVTGMMIREGLLVAGIGSAVGLAGAMGYAWLMLAGLRTWWSDAANAPFLRLHVETASMVIGFCASVGVSLASIAYAIRGLSRSPVRGLLAGSTRERSAVQTRRDRRQSLVIAVGSFVGCAILVVLAAEEQVGDVGAFFGAGALLLVGGLAVWRTWLISVPQRGIQGYGRFALVRIGIRNAPRNPGRSMLTAGLIASATFLIVAIGAFRVDNASDDDLSSGTGGFTLYAESATQLPYDLGSLQGRESLNIAEETSQLLEQSVVISLRLRPGDESSCLNLYRSTRPRILGAASAMIQQGGFKFAALSPDFDSSSMSPWELLESTLPDGAIPVFGDEAAVRWQLHLGLAQDLVISDERGRDVILRFVGLLKGQHAARRIDHLRGAVRPIVPVHRRPCFFPDRCGFINVRGY